METISLLQEEENNIPPPELQSFTTESANSVSTMTSMESLLTLIKNLEKKVDNINKPSSAVTTTSSSRDKNNNNTTGNNNNINPKTGLPWKRYCWTCGCCTHWSKNCTIKAPGHQDQATFKNRMGGSNRNCR